jgi:hypothetical protein
VRKTAIIFFLTTALLLVLGHSVFPHNHISGACCSHCISIKKKLSLTEIIRNSLSQDLGANHLEEYKQRQQSGFKFINLNGFIAITDYSLPYIDFLWERNNRVFSHSPNSRYSNRPTGSRAPPAVQ